ncbi:enoyl-CoA hydratase-related protein [Salinibacterium sp. ZJ454]|uniref:enoyl-CoA hydratase/isomerase family protein n=1 Tax=Salinibacterium sp. ZJ454 TaxID=2708339 RepID=UPI00142400B7|nr:enoyl-CoA hydratase-related protein [Salinibacterium sp. ZJ454]
MNLPETIILEVEDHVATITINRPERRNSTTPEMRDAIREAFRWADAESDIWVIIFTGAGEQAFCAGADLSSSVTRMTADPTAGIREAFPDPSKRYFSDVFTPIIAAVNGVATAGGMEMLLGTDLRIAAEHASFGLAEVRWGLVPMGGSHVRLPRQVPWAVAMQMLLTGDRIDARRAYEIGLVNEVTSAAELMPTARRLAARLTENGPLAMRTAKESAVRGLHLESAFSQDYYLAGRVFGSHDAVEGPRAFTEKRPPQFENR